jgi:hypothetical protein
LCRERTPTLTLGHRTWKESTGTQRHRPISNGIVHRAPPQLVFATHGRGHSNPAPWRTGQQRIAHKSSHINLSLFLLENVFSGAMTTDRDDPFQTHSQLLMPSLPEDHTPPFLLEARLGWPNNDPHAPSRPLQRGPGVSRVPTWLRRSDKQRQPQPDKATLSSRPPSTTSTPDLFVFKILFPAFQSISLTASSMVRQWTVECTGSRRRHTDGLPRGCLQWAAPCQAGSAGCQ